MGHPFNFTGVYKTSKYDARFHLFQVRHSLHIGFTRLSEYDIDQLVDQWKSSYMGSEYDTITKHSIHFARQLFEQISHDLQSMNNSFTTNIQRFPTCKIVLLLYRDSLSLTCLPQMLIVFVFGVPNYLF